MRINSRAYQLSSIILLVLGGGLIQVTSAQVTTDRLSTNTTQQQTTTTQPTIILQQQQRAPGPVARQTETLCGGYIQYQPARINLEIVGAEEEQEQRTFSEGDYVFINAGVQQGLREGQEFAIIRPRGRFSSKFSKKRGTLGVYTQEMGILRIINVKSEVSVAQITTSCETVLLGDLLVPMQQRVIPTERVEVSLDRFSNPTNKQNGRIVMARDNRETVSKDQIVYIDLGAEDNIKAGDYLTIYRPLNTGNITRVRNEEITPNTRSGFESERFRGGKFSNKAQRTRSPEGRGVLDRSITTPEIRARRPTMPRKIVGEMVVLNVQQRTATAVITRVAQEVHTGDYVELQ